MRKSNPAEYIVFDDDYNRIIKTDTLVSAKDGACRIIEGQPLAEVFICQVLEKMKLNPDKYIVENYRKSGK